MEVGSAVERMTAPLAPAPGDTSDRRMSATNLAPKARSRGSVHGDEGSDAGAEADEPRSDHRFGGRTTKPAISGGFLCVIRVHLSAQLLNFRPQMSTVLERVNKPAVGRALELSPYLQGLDP